MPTQQRNPAVQLLTFSDFSPGIVQRIGTVGAVANSPSPIGAASITNTYRCISLPGGGLGPLPKNTTNLSFTDKSTSNLPAGVTAAATGFLLYGPMYKETSGGQFAALSSTPFEIHLGYEYVSGGSQVQTWRKYPYYSSDASVVINTESNTPTTPFGPTYFALTCMADSAPTTLGYPVIVGCWNQVRDPDEGDNYCYIYPDPTDVTTVITDTPLSLGTAASIVFAHQSRLVFLIRGRTFHGANSGIAPTNEGIRWTLPNESTVETPGVAQFGLEAPYGYGAWGSLTSSDLLLIKHNGGAYLIQGDINNPIVRRFPSVLGTNGVEVIGTATNLGFIYGVNDDGVYAWQGGDASLLLSPQLEDGFWQTPTSTYRFAGQFQSWGNLVLCPNNFLLDTKTSAWWRIEDPATRLYYCWQIDPMNNIAYGLRPTFSDTSGVYAGGFNSGTPAVNYSWQSQPFNVFDRRRTLIRGVYITAQGAGTITVTFSSDEGPTSVFTQPNAWNISTTGPTRVRLAAQVYGSEFVMRIVSDGGATAAPIVYTVDVEVLESTQHTTE